MWRDDASLLDMLIWARRAVEYTGHVPEEAFREDRLVQDATIRCLMAIGEAAVRVSIETRENRPEIEWPEIIGMRNRLAHEYSRVDVCKVWLAATGDCPRLIAQLERIVPAEAGAIPDEWEFL